MSIRTIEELSDLPADELAWRKKELADMRTLIESPTLRESRRNALLRCGITMLYAHWEGFINASGNAYIEFVARQKLPYKDLSLNFVAVGIRQLLHNASMSRTSRDHNTLVSFFLTRMSERSSLPYRNAIDTQSNLSSKVFRDIVEKLGLDYSLHETKEKLIDHLQDSRNTIAHGSYLQTDLEGYVNIQDEMLGMMELFRNQIENSAITRAYRV